MRILVIGAGATGGYFGGRLLESGQDVSFLVRERRAAQLAEHGLVIRSSFGDATLPHPPTVQAGELREAFDLILLSCKAYHLPQVIEDMAPAVGPHTAILPVLNGMRHLDLLDARFGVARARVTKFTFTSIITMACRTPTFTFTRRKTSTSRIRMRLTRTLFRVWGGSRC